MKYLDFGWAKNDHGNPKNRRFFKNAILLPEASVIEPVNHDHLRIIQVRQNFNLSLGDNLKRPQKFTFGWSSNAEIFTVYALIFELAVIKISAI